MRRALCGASVVLFFVACGGAGGTTKAEYVREANAVCRDAAKRTAALEAPAAHDVDSVAKASVEVVAVQRRALEQIRDITVPDPDEAEIARWIALVDQTIDQAEISAESQKEGDLARAVTANVNGAALDARADDLARRYGLSACVQASTAPTSASTSDPTESSASRP